MSLEEDREQLLETARRNRAGWDSESAAYQDMHAEKLEDENRRAWGIWRIAESELNVLGDVAGLRILELGCGGAQWSSALAEDGADVVGLDNSWAQLNHALGAGRDDLPLVHASAEFLPFVPGSFDIVFCDYGAMTFADPYAAVPEAARVLKPGGVLAFMTTSPFFIICLDVAADEVVPALQRPYFGLHRFEVEGDETVDFQLPYGEWIRLFRTNGFTVEDLIEIRPPEGATTSFGGRPLEWSRKWPAEMIWRLRREDRG
ncbi:MAG: class I SAM-dependent methyltransferase [Actinomycetota bacterium]